MEALKKLRQKFKLKQRDMAKILDITVSGYCNIENDRNHLTLEHLLRICKYFDISADAFLGLKQHSLAFTAPEFEKFATAIKIANYRLSLQETMPPYDIFPNTRKKSHEESE